MKKKTPLITEPPYDYCMRDFLDILGTLPPAHIELLCLAARLITVDPATFGAKMAAEYNRRGFTTDLF